MGATYRGIHSSEFGLVVKTNPMILPNHENKLTPIPGMPGAHYSGSEYDVGRIPLEISFIAKDIHDYSTRLRMLADWLRPDDGIGEYIADYEPDKVYFAVLESSAISRVELIAKMGEGTLELICPDPFAYGRDVSYSLQGNTTVANEGTVEAKPVFELEVLEDTTLIEITNNSHLTPEGVARTVVLGEPADVEDEKIETRRLVLHDSMRSTSGWETASSVDNGQVTGSFGVDEDGFFVEDWGENEDDGMSNVWIGPSLKRSIGEGLKSFEADIYISNRNTGSEVSDEAVGIIEVYMRDVNDNLVCKIQFGDTFDNAAENRGVFVTDGKRFPAKHDRPGGWNNFEGLLRIKRDSNYYYPYIAQIINGQHTGRFKYGQIIPGPGIGSHEISTIQIAMRKWVGAKRMYQRIKEIKVYEFRGMYEFGEKEVPVEFKKGDIITIEGTRAKLNGEDRPDIINVDTDFFSLVEGLNRLELSSNVQGKVTFKNRYL